VVMINLLMCEWVAVTSKFPSLNSHIFEGSNNVLMGFGNQHVSDVEPKYLRRVDYVSPISKLIISKLAH
jgi:hypothetical protein